ncbi:ATP-binding protein [Bacillus safensis]|uniref:HD domain-containing protein n=1 Tax=Bacillus safensis TaxID=561879 RepID=UPI002B251BFE|nr:ATP-binding protein [Bacillus safensis]MEB2271234.1 ATP-binding protein [Bacillus safensis]
MNLENTKLMMELNRRQSSFYFKIQEVYKEVESVLNNRIPRIFPYYTQHDVGHSLRIMDFMYDLIEEIDNLNDLELALIIYSALLHDIGMAPDDNEILDIKNGKLTYEGLNYEILLEQFHNDHTLALQEFIREVHAFRSSEYIKNKLSHHFFIPDMPEVLFVNELAKICEAHTKDFYWLIEELDVNIVKGTYDCNLQYSAMLLRIGDILDFDSSRTPTRLLEAAKPFGYSLGEWKQHFVIENKQKVNTNDTGIKIIEFYGECEEPKIHRKILNYFSWVETEINNALELSGNFNNKHKFNLHYRINNFIRSKDYKIVDLKFEFNYLNIIEILMGEGLYGNKKYGLREIIQNCIDTCNHKKIIYKQIKEPWENDYVGTIDIILKKSKNEVIIKDNGIGMDYSIIKRYFLELGSSYYKSKEFKHLDSDYKPIGNYGIGFLAGFMISPKILVRTRHYKSNSIIELEIEKDEQYVAMKEVERPDFVGTEIILNLNDFLSIWDSNIEDLQNYLIEQFLFKDINVHLNIENEDGGYKKIIINDLELTEGVDLSHYLDGVELTLKYFKNSIVFKKYLLDLLEGNVVSLEDEEIVYIPDTDETILLKNYVQNSKLETIELILVDDEKLPALERALELDLDDDDIIDYVWEYSPPTLEVITSDGILSKNVPTLYENSEYVINFDIEKLNKIDDIYHNNEFGTIYTKKEYNLFTVNGTDKYLELINHDDRENLISWRINPKYYYYRKMFVRGVFVKELSSLNVENAIKNISIQDIKINVLNPSIIPTVNRNSFKESDEIILMNSIYIAICLDILDNTEDYLEKMLMRKYLDIFMESSNSLIKEEFHPKS